MDGQYQVCTPYAGSPLVMGKEKQNEVNFLYFSWGSLFGI